MNTTVEQLKFKKYPVLDQGFICLVDAMGDDSSIVQAARVSYGKDTQETIINKERGEEIYLSGNGDITDEMCIQQSKKKDRQLIRYLMSHSHTTPFEMVEIKFMVQVPMDCWRQWIRHRTANVNEYSTRYTEALDFFQVTQPDQWRLQATDNKQGSSGYLQKDLTPETNSVSESLSGWQLTQEEAKYHAHARSLYNRRLQTGIAKEQARKDLPLSTYTRAYWKCDLHNIFNFLRLRMDSHAQYEIRMYANAMYEIVKQIVPVACEAFEDYVLNACKFSAMEMKIIRDQFCGDCTRLNDVNSIEIDKPSTMSVREFNDFCKKVGVE